MRPRLLFSLGVALTFLILPFFATSVYWLGYRYYQDHPRVEATVTALREFTPRVGDATNYLSIVSLRYPVDGGRVQQTSAQFFTADAAEHDTWHHRFTPGAHVDVRYARAEPGRLVLADRDAMDQQARILLTITAGLFLVSLSLAYVGKRKAI